MTDTLWVKSEREEVSWSQVNLYENKFDEDTSKYSFDGNRQINKEMTTTSPELTTDGAYDKCWLNREDGIHLIKTGSNYVAPAKAILTPEIKACVEDIRETPLTLECDERFTEERLATMNMIKNVQCDRILGFDTPWKW